ncbi:hypothetical protein WR25_12387 [Diploscapter pachys]|uniref:C-type lectin domain-containing protein n=1 Tax=Diploscapter pachys TaxID=2018661 RepID=A0A2A2J9Z6_9BILA|nr:hypothetical protein WR25_12387 [Diploscapter pachys]
MSAGSSTVKATSALISVPTTCPDPFMFVYDSCFSQLTPGDNRDNSLAECMNLNPMAHLWFPTSGPQNNAVQLEFGHDYWLGIHEEPPPGSDNWVYDDGSPLVYTNWYTMGGQPDPGPGVGPETCVDVSNEPDEMGQWSDSDCSLDNNRPPFYFIKQLDDDNHNNHNNHDNDINNDNAINNDLCS